MKEYVYIRVNDVKELISQMIVDTSDIIIIEDYLDVMYTIIAFKIIIETNLARDNIFKDVKTNKLYAEYTTIAKGYYLEHKILEFENDNDAILWFKLQ